MNYYNQTNKADIDEIRKELEQDGFIVSVSHSKGEIRREDNKYRNSMKWHFTEKNENGDIFYSDWFTSKSKFLEWLNAPRRPMPIPNGMSLSYIEILT